MLLPTCAPRIAQPYFIWDVHTPINPPPRYSRSYSTYASAGTGSPYAPDPRTSHYSTVSLASSSTQFPNTAPAYLILIQSL